MGKRYILKVFSGPHHGAEIILSRGKLLVGRGERCDIILYDSAISLEHVELIISDQEILVSSIDQPIFIEGKELLEKTVKVETYQFITIGTTHLSIGINGEDWPQITIPELNPLKEESVQNTDAPLDPITGSNLNILSFSGISGVLTKYLVGSKYSKLPATLSLLLTTGVAVAASILFDGTSSKQQATFASLSNDGIFQKHKSSNKAVEISSGVLDELQEKIAQEDFPDIDIKQQNSKLLVSGSVINSTQKKQLNKLLEPYFYIVKQQVYIKERQISSAKTIASELKIEGLDFSITKPHILSVKGYIENQDDWLQAKQILNNDLEGIREIDDQEVETQNHRIQELQKLLEEQELISLIDIKSTPGQLLAMGELTTENVQRWETIAYAFKQRYGKHPLLKEKIILLKTDPNDLDIQIRGIVTTGDDGNIVLTASGSYREGERFPNGFTIKNIEPKKVILSRNHQTIELPINNSAPAENAISNEPTNKL